MNRLVLACVLILLGTATDATDDQAWMDRGAATLAPFKQQLKRELLDGMKKGTANAIDVCAIKAPEIAKVLGSESVVVGRTSHKVRNAANAPRPWMKPLLAAYLENPSERQPRLVHLENGSIGYVEPIIAQPLCLTCHGSSLTEETRHAISEKYPRDEATGFENGDLRGMFWVEFRPK